MQLALFVRWNLWTLTIDHLIGGAENAGVENAGEITYGKPSEQKTLKIPGV